MVGSTGLCWEALTVARAGFAAAQTRASLKAEASASMVVELSGVGAWNGEQRGCAEFGQEWLWQVQCVSGVC